MCDVVAVDVAVAVIVVIMRCMCVLVVVVVVMVSAVMVLCVFCGCCVSIVVCTCECFALDHNDFVGFSHGPPRKSKTRNIFLFFILRKITRNYPEGSKKPSGLNKTVALMTCLRRES